jgi:hypothetical protein
VEIDSGERIRRLEHLGGPRGAADAGCCAGSRAADTFVFGSASLDESSAAGLARAEPWENRGNEQSRAHKSAGNCAVAEQELPCCVVLFPQIGEDRLKGDVDPAKGSPDLVDDTIALVDH